MALYCTGLHSIAVFCASSPSPSSHAAQSNTLTFDRSGAANVAPRLPLEQGRSAISETATIPRHCSRLQSITVFRGASPPASLRTAKSAPQLSAGPTPTTFLAARFLGTGLAATLKRRIVDGDPPGKRTGRQVFCEVAPTLRPHQPIQSAAAVAAMLVAGVGVYAVQDTGQGGSEPGTGRSASVTSYAVTGEFRNREACADESAGSVANLVERLARRAEELQGQKRHAEAQAVVREVVDVVAQWEGRLRAERAFHKSTGGGVSTGSAAEPSNNTNNVATGAGGSSGSAFGTSNTEGGASFARGQSGIAARSAAPLAVTPPNEFVTRKVAITRGRPAAPRAVAPNPGAETVEQRLGRVEQQLGEILKRLDRRADGDDTPRAKP